MMWRKLKCWLSHKRFWSAEPIYHSYLMRCPNADARGSTMIIWQILNCRLAPRHTLKHQGERQ